MSLLGNPGSSQLAALDLLGVNLAHVFAQRDTCSSSKSLR